MEFKRVCILLNLNLKCLIMKNIIELITLRSFLEIRTTMLNYSGII